ncbi:MAG: carbon-nitrogen hydrolase family protein [Parvibaculaceae bacterium]|nr:carbon-nitrogen hydrolase family protein [Parvibaculaceae bacterium]
MKLALWQTRGFPGDIGGNLASLEPIAQSAAAAGAELLLLPELWLSGYNLPDLIPALAEPADGPSFSRIADIARRNNIVIAYGYAERPSPEQPVYNSVQVVGTAGAPLAHYRKTHLFESMEKSLYTPGDVFEPPFSLGEWKIALLICYDVEFPENVRTHALAGTDLILVPTALSPEFTNVPDWFVPARAVENTLFIAYCNHCGEENGLLFLGGSKLAGPDGRTIVAAGEGEALLIADIDLAARKKAAPTFPYLRDRRPELYSSLGKD